MNILLLGNGGREHAFAWKMAQSPRCTRLYVANGNAGTAQCATNVGLSLHDFEAIKQFVREQEIEMVVVGPEEPLVLGIYDFFKNDPATAHLPLIGPSQAGARLEGSKAYAKAFMGRWHIPTAGYRTFTAETLTEGRAYIATQTPPIVLKADGLAAGKGVLIIHNIEEAQAAFEQMLGGKFGAASSRVVVEEFLTGIEFSVFAATDGKHYALLPVAKDYKRVGEGDTGLNTGGMGAVSPVSFVDAPLMQKVIERIVAPTVKGLQAEGIDYKGFIFFGLISVKGEPYVIEYNCRMGDPETEAVLPRLKTDLVLLCEHIANGTLDQLDLQTDARTATTVFLVSGGYPEAYQKGKLIQGLESAAADPSVLLFHAGTSLDADGLVRTNGGRVLAVTAFGQDLADALALAKYHAARIDFEGKYYRTDIGFDL